MKQAQQLAQERPEVAQQIQGSLQQIFARSATDLEFREKLLNTPHEALAEFAGKTSSEVPEALLDITFVESETDFGNENGALIALPEYQGSAEELSEDQLETVAGGTGFTCGVAGAALVATAVEVINNPEDVESSFNDAVQD